MNAYISAFQRYFDFKGRSSRKDFWMFTLFNMIVTGGLKAIAGVLVAQNAGNSALAAAGLVMMLYSTFVFIPSLAVSVRRLHDTGRSGWWLLLLFINLIFFCLRGTSGDNCYGPDPLQKS